MNQSQKLLWLSLFLIVIGRSSQMLFQDFPLRTVLWDQQLVESILESLFNLNWIEFSTNPKFSLIIDLITKIWGGVLLLSCVGSLIFRTKKTGKILLGLISLQFLVIALLFTKEKFYHAAQFFEFSIQLSVPLLLIKNKVKLLKLAIGFTFIAHGLYACNLYPIPGEFIDMTIKLLHLSENPARHFLLLVGFLDILFGVLILVNGGHQKKLIYLSIWGLVTAFARWGANVDLHDLIPSSVYWLTHVLYRLPHAILPFILYHQLRKVNHLNPLPLLFRNK